ncbi:DUF7007 domain-containing protein [Isoptericola croceus]|uniref:DUF7007 domain-containing protein n=1 Tax=Isoptericola croceus TaxID=3031406 RepID=UPI0023F77E6D|nr:hypothetical protein [Isoptericola croceus]
MSTFIEDLHPRSGDGKFATKAVDEADGGLSALSPADAAAPGRDVTGELTDRLTRGGIAWYSTPGGSPEMATDSPSDTVRCVLDTFDSAGLWIRSEEIAGRLIDDGFISEVNYGDEGPGRCWSFRPAEIVREARWHAGPVGLDADRALSKDPATATADDLHVVLAAENDPALPEHHRAQLAQWAKGARHVAGELVPDYDYKDISQWGYEPNVHYTRVGVARGQRSIAQGITQFSTDTSGGYALSDERNVFVAPALRSEDRVYTGVQAATVEAAFPREVAAAETQDANGGRGDILTFTRDDLAAARVHVRARAACGALYDARLYGGGSTR